MARYPLPGSVLLGKYRVDSLIGEGGMGVVIKAHHLDLDEPVAIKCLLPEMLDRQEIVTRFVREAKAAVKLKGEHVARVLDVGRLENRIPYIVMEYLEGADLGAIVKHHGSQEPSIAVDLILQACEAIAEAHSLGIIHRDIKASNFFVTQPANQAPVLKVLDFGIATAPEGTSDLTSTQSVIGTPAYMAPEQMRSSRLVDARSDIWSIGVVLYELLEGARPFRSDVYSELCLKVGMDPPVPITEPAVPDGLEAITMKCLEKSVEKRYQTVAELAFDLMPYASDPVAARAAVEQCARLLGRRGSRAFEAAKVDTGPFERDDSMQLPVPRLTPTSAQYAAPNDPGQPKTPTSIGASNGQFAMPMAPQRGRRGWVIGLTALVLVGAGGAGFYVIDSNAKQGLVPASSPAPAIEPEPPVAESEPSAPPAAETAEPTAAEPAAEPKTPETPVAEATPEPDVAAVERVRPRPVRLRPTSTRPVSTAKPKSTSPPPPPPAPPPEPVGPGGKLFEKRQ
jgi:serine/threonine-protein kinase